LIQVIHDDPELNRGRGLEVTERSERSGRPLSGAEKLAAAFVLLGAFATLAYALGESWIG
jgi:hypothetical protein